MDWKDHITSDKGVLLGKPVIRGTRLSVEHIIGLLAEGWTEDRILENHPRLTTDGLKAVFLYLKDCMRDGLLHANG